MSKNIPDTVKVRAAEHGIECGSSRFYFIGPMSYGSVHLVLFNCAKCEFTLAARMKDSKQEYTGSFSL